MKRAVLYSLAGITALMTLAATAPFLLPASLYKDRIEDSVSRATGRKFTIAGSLHFSLFPALAIRADRVALANIPGGHAQNFAEADDIRFGVRLWPLLSGRLELTHIVLDTPAFALESEADGRANWLFDHASHTPRVGHGATGFTTQFSTVEIIDGRVRYTNVQTGIARTIDDVHAMFEVGQSNQSVRAEGTFALNGRRVAFKSDAAISPADRRIAATDLSLSSDLVDAKFGGKLNQNGSLDGDISLQTSSARDAGTWLGARMPNINGLGALSFKSHVQTDESVVTLHALSASLDGMSIGGDLSIDTRGRVPRIEGSLRIDHLNVNPYIEHPHKTVAHRAKDPDDQWSKEPIALDALKAVDAHLSITAGDISVRKLKLGRTDIHVDLADSDLRASLAPMALYGGTGKAFLHIDARRSTPYFHNDLEVSDIVLREFLSDTIGVKHVEGIGNIKLDIASTGANANAIMHGVSGRGSISFRNGRMHGVDFGAVARTVQTFLGTAITSDAVTAYTTMGGSFTASNGVLTNQDFQFAGPLLTAKGGGTIDVGNRTIDFRIEPQASAVIAKQKLTVGIPFRIAGPWEHLRYKADLNSLVKGVMDNLESGKAPFKDLFGPSKSKNPNAPKKKHKSVEDALKNMLGIH